MVNSINDINKVIMQSKIEDDIVFSLEVERHGGCSVYILDPKSPLLKTSQKGEEVFEKVIKAIDPIFLKLQGKKYQFQDKKGKRCDLMISFHSNDAQKTFQFIYGLESSSPPREVMNLVEVGIEAARSLQ